MVCQTTAVEAGVITLATLKHFGNLLPFLHMNPAFHFLCNAKGPNQSKYLDNIPHKKRKQKLVLKLKLFKKGNKIQKDKAIHHILKEMF